MSFIAGVQAAAEGRVVSPALCPEADALAVPGAECLVIRHPPEAEHEGQLPPTWERFGATRSDGVHLWRGWRWIALAEDLAAPTEWTRGIARARVRVYDRAGSCVWDSADDPPPVARVDPPKRKPAALPPGLVALLLEHHDRWDDVRALLRGGEP